MSSPDLDEVVLEPARMRSTIEAVLCSTLINAPINEDMIREVLLAAAAVASLGGNPAAWLSGPRVREEMERLRPHVNPAGTSGRVVDFDNLAAFTDADVEEMEEVYRRVVALAEAPERVCSDEAADNRRATLAKIRADLARRDGVKALELCRKLVAVYRADDDDAGWEDVVAVVEEIDEAIGIDAP